MNGQYMVVDIMDSLIIEMLEKPKTNFSTKICLMKLLTFWNPWIDIIICFLSKIFAAP